MTRRIFLFLSFFYALNAGAQTQFAHKYEWKIWEDSLAAIVEKTFRKKMVEGSNIAEDSAAIKLVIYMLQRDKKLEFDFDPDHLFIKALYDPQRTFRVITWFFLQSPGYLVYRGVTQFKGDGKLIPFFDETRFIENADNGRQTDDMQSPDRWYGAFYYDMIPYSLFSKEQKNKYVLLGKKQSYVLYDAKVIDVLTIENDHTIKFGDYFEAPKGDHTMVPASNRFVMLSKKNIGTILDFKRSTGQIVFDALDIEKDEDQHKLNNKIYLIPTGRYHAFIYKEGFGWKFQPQAFEQFQPQDFFDRKNQKIKSTNK